MGRFSFNSNVAALGVQRQLAQTTSEIGQVYERLSSGMRINKASDDAAGLAIADRLNADQRLYTAAQRNIHDAISAIRIAEGTVAEQKNILNRMIELAEQSANGVYSREQRGAMDDEYEALMEEFGRIGNATEFNGIELLRGVRGDNAEQIFIQAGIRGDLNSILQLDAVDTGNFSGHLNFDEISYASAVPDSVTEEEIFNTFGNIMFSATLTDNNGQEREVLVGADSYSLALNGLDPEMRVRFQVYQRVSDTGGVGSVTAAGPIGRVLDENDDWVLAASFGDIAFEAETGFVLGDGVHTANLQFDNFGVAGTLEVNFEGLQIQAVIPQGWIDFGLATEQNTNRATSAIEFTGVETANRSLTALETLKNRIDDLSSIQGEFGALVSRLESALSINGATKENVAAAESRIRDADIGEETSKLVAANIRQQAAAAVMAQAVSQPELLLGLLFDL